MPRDDPDHTSWAEAALDIPRTRAGAAVLLDRADVDQYSSLTEVIAYASSRHWQVLECGNNIVVFPNSRPIKRHP